MGIELGSIGSAIGNVANSVGRAGAAISEAPAARGLGRPLAGFEPMTAPSVMPNLGGTLQPGGLLDAPKVNIFGAEMLAPSEPILNEGPVGIGDLNMSTNIFKAGQFNPKGEIAFHTQPKLETNDMPLEAADMLAQAEAVLAQARVQKEAPKVLEQEPVVPGEVIQEAEQRMGIIYQFPQKENQFVEVGPKIEPEEAPKILQFPRPKAAISPALGNQIKPAEIVMVQSASRTQPDNQAAVQIAQAVKPEPKLEEQEEVVEEVIMQNKPQTAAEQIEEEAEEIRLKNVVDEEVLNNRIDKYTRAAKKVVAQKEAAKAQKASQDGNLLKPEEHIKITGQEINKIVGPETEDEISGILEKRGPDGSREETSVAIGAQEFGSLEEANKYIVTTIHDKVPVKRAVTGDEVGPEAVIRVLRRRFVKFIQPQTEQVAHQITKKRKIQIVKEQPVTVVEQPKQRKEPNLAELNPELAQALLAPKAA